MHRNLRVMDTYLKSGKNILYRINYKNVDIPIAKNKL